MTSTTKISALDFHNALIVKDGIHSASGFGAKSRTARFEIIARCMSQGHWPKLLDYGCYDGELFTHTWKWISSYIGIDINPKFIRFAKKRWHGHPTTKFMTGNVLEDTTWRRIQHLKPDVIVASGVMCYSGDADSYPELVKRLFGCAQDLLVFNALAADVPKRFQSNRLAVPTKGIIRWKIEALLKIIRSCQCVAWDIHRSYLHNDVTIVMRKKWTHFT